MLLQGPQTPIVMYNYLALTGASNNNCNVKFLACFQRRPQQKL